MERHRKMRSRDPGELRVIIPPGGSSILSSSAKIMACPGLYPPVMDTSSEVSPAVEP